MRIQFAIVIRFQSTLSMRRATVQGEHLTTVVDISIHALHEESDGSVHGDSSGR